MRQRPAQQGRSALLWGLGTFAVLQVGLAVAIETCLSELRDPSYAHKARRLLRRTAEPRRPPLVVMLGSSRVEQGLRGKLLEGQGPAGSGPVVFNFGVSGAGPVIELLVLHRLLAEGVRPDLLLIEVLPPFLAGQRPSPEVDRLTVDRLWLRELPLASRYGRPLAELRTDWWRSWPLPCYSHRFAILARVAPLFLAGRVSARAFNRSDESGWCAPAVAAATPESYCRGLACARLEYAPLFADFRLGGTGCAALRELLELCRQEHLATALVLMPEGKDFRDLYPPPAWGEIEAFLTELSREYGVPVVNAREWVGGEHFSDSHHLLPSGAALFTERLGRECVAPLLAGAGSTSGEGEPLNVPVPVDAPGPGSDVLRPASRPPQGAGLPRPRHRAPR